MTAQPTCIDLAMLKQFVQGKVNGAEAAVLEEHLLACDSCAAKLNTLVTEDTLTEAMRSHVVPAESDSVQRLIERLRRLRSGDETTSEVAPPIEKENFDFLSPAQAPGEMGRLGPYRVVKVLGAGGMGVVFQAEDLRLKRTVALKAMRPTLAVSETAKQRFLREAQANASLKHDHVVTIYDVGEDRGVPYLAMEFLEGESLDAWLKRGRTMTVPEILRIGREIALGLAAAHDRKLIHRDVKPANLWLESRGEPGASVTGERIKILDFGLARAVGEQTQLTQSGAIVGTPAFMAPEQATSDEIDHRCDLFSLGCVLYRLCTGELPFKGKDTMKILMALATEEPLPVLELNAAIPEALADLVMRLLKKKPGDRPANAKAVAETLQAIQRATDSSAVAVAPGGPAADIATNVTDVSQPRARSRTAWGIAASVLLVFAVGLFAAQIVLRVRDKDGKVTEVPVQPGATIDVLDGSTTPAGAGGAPMFPSAIVGAPAQLPGVKSWTIAPRADTREMRHFIYSPDGKLLASTADGDCLVRVWDAQNLTLIKILAGPEYYNHNARLLAWSPDGTQLAVSQCDRGIWIWSFDNGKVRHHLKSDGHALAWSPDGKLLASGEDNGLIRIWNTATGEQELPPLAGLSSRVWNLAWLDGGKSVATYQGITIHSWSLQTRQGGGSNVAGAVAGSEIVAWSKDGRKLAIGNHATRRLLIAESTTGKVLREITTSTPVDKHLYLNWSANGNVISRYSLPVEVLDAVTGDVLVKLPLTTEALGGALSPDGKTLGLSRLAGEEPDGIGIDFYAIPSGKKVGTIARRKFRSSEDHLNHCWSPDGQMLASASSQTTGAARLWDLRNGNVRYLESAMTSIYALAWSPNGKILAAGAIGQGAQWDLGSGKKISRLACALMTWSPDGKHLASSNGTTLWITKQPSGERRDLTVPEAHEVRALAWSPDGKQLAALCCHPSTPKAFVWQQDQPKPFQTYPAEVLGYDSQYALSWAPDGLSISFADRCVEIESGKALHRWKQSAYACDHFGDNTIVAAAYKNCVLTDKATGKPLGRGFIGDHATVRPKLSNLVATDCWDGSIRLSDAKTGAPRGALFGLGYSEGLAIGMNGHYRGPKWIEEEIVYLVETEDGRQETYKPAEFSKKFGWKNDPEKVRFEP